MKLMSCLRQFFDASRHGAHHPDSKRKVFRPSLESLEERTVPTVFTVNSLADDNVGSGNSGDLRYVINRANALNTGTLTTPDLIQFTSITLTQDNQTINVGAGAAGKTPLPALRDIVIIDGTTAGGFYTTVPDCPESVQTGLIVTLDGHSLLAGNGLALQGGSATIRGLQIINFPGHGILVSSSNNTIGGDLVGYNAECERNNPAGRITTHPIPNPPTTNPVSVRPPQGNVISANGGDGVRIVNADSNLLEGNFIGTDINGTAARGNAGDGVAIVNSNNTSLFGTTPIDQDNPFVFYNVISGNKGNGLVVEDSDNTLIYANFFGLGADNNKPVGNGLNGVLIKGTSDRTRFGLNIPLGNVSAANGLNGVEVRDSASRTLLMNTFGGIAAFRPEAHVPNHGNGALITSNGGGIFYEGARFTTLIVTCQFSGNDHNGLEIGGNAVGVQVSQSVIGMETNGTDPEPNNQDGIAIGGNASGIAIGGFEPSVLGGNEFPAGTFPDFEAANLISGNLGNGISVGGHAQDVKIVNSLIGTDINQQEPAANGRNGILIDDVSGVQIGPATSASTPRDRNVIGFNPIGVLIDGPGAGNAVLGNSIYENPLGGIILAAGGNNNQPAPLITNVVLTPTNNVQISGTLAAANSAYTIQVFASPAQSPGQGKTFLGSVSVNTNSAGIATFVFDGPLPANAGLSFTATATDSANNTSSFSAPMSAAIFAVGADAGGGPQVNVYSVATGQLLLSFLAYDAGFTGGVRVAVGDINGDSVQEIITGPGVGGGPNVRVFDSRTGTTISGPLSNFMSFNEAFTGGVYVASGDTNGDGHADVIVGAGAGGGPNVIVYSGANGALLQNFMAYDAAFTGGVSVAAGDLTGDDDAEIICGPGAGGGPNVSVFSGVTGARLQSFFAFDSAFSGGIYVAAGDTNGDGQADIIVGAGAGGGPNVAVFSGVGGTLLQNFFALPAAFTGGIRVGSFPENNTGRAAILTSAGPGGGPQVTAFAGVSLAVLDSFFAFAPGFTGGVFVGGAL